MTTKEYMPEVGIECEFSNKGLENWREAKILATHAGYAWIETTIGKGIGTYHIPQIEFRPIKTKQDIEREEAIEHMVNISPYDPPLNMKEFAEALYDAGYHNGVKVGDEVGPTEVDICIGVWHECGDDTLWEHLLRHFKIYPRGE